MGYYSVADWHISPDGAGVRAVNRKTREEFVGTVLDFNLKMQTPEPSPLGDTGSYQFIFDDVDATTTYVGKASPTALASEPMWSIAKYTTSGNSGSVKFAVGSAARGAIWNDRASLIYL